MKKIICLSAICLALLLTSCTKEVESNLPIENKTSIKKKDVTEKVNTVTYHFVYITWEQFGRKLLNCLGWGLCYFEGCINCCEDNGVIVDCPTTIPQMRAGVMMIEDGQSEGILTIKLNPNDPEQENAINNTLTLYVDEDIDNDGYIIHEGQYSYDPNVGSDGGYVLNVTEK